MSWERFPSRCKYAQKVAQLSITLYNMLIRSVTPQKHGPHEGIKLTQTAVFGAHTSFKPADRLFCGEF